MLISVQLLFSLISAVLAVNPVSLYDLCLTQIRTSCIPTIATCAADICYACTSLNIVPSIEPCCAAPTPAACFAADYVNGVTSSAAYPVTLSREPVPSNLATLSAASSLITDSAQLSSELSALATSCQSESSVYSSCAAATPNLRDLSFSDQQSCICSTAGTYAPSLWDNYFSGCLKYASLIEPSEYSAQGPTGGGVLTGVHGSLTYLGSRPCESYSQITATRTTAMNTTNSVSVAISSSFGPASSHGIADGHMYGQHKVGMIVIAAVVQVVAMAP